MKVLVTGANGFLGRHVVAGLIRRDIRVRALVRSREKIRDCEWKDDVSVFEGDLRHSRNLQTALKGIDAVIHLAASKGGDEDEQFDSTVVGTERLLEAMHASDVRRLLLISSLAVYDFESREHEFSEDSSLEAFPYNRDGYAISKVWQERIVRRMSQQYDLKLTVVRPAMVWGDTNEYPLVLSLPAGPFHFVIGPGGSPKVVYVKNCAKFIIKVLENPASIGQTYNLIDDNRVSTWNFMGRFLHVNRSKGVRVPVPYFAAYTIIRAVYAVARLILKDNLKVPSIFVPKRFAARFRPLAWKRDKTSELMGEDTFMDLQESIEDYQKTGSRYG